MNWNVILYASNIKGGHSGCTREFGMLLLGKMRRQTGEMFVDPTGML